MKKTFGDIRNVIILVLIIVILLLRQCSGGGEITPTEPTIITKTEVRYDTITKEVPKYIPKIVTRIERNIDTLLIAQNVDTLSILKDYFAKYVYVDVQTLDSLNLVITDTLTENRILARSIKYDLIYPTVTVTETKYINPREFYIGFGLNGNTTQFNYVGAQLLYRSRKKQAFGLGIGINENLQPILSTQFLWKLGK